jgi:hypothetical protein
MGYLNRRKATWTDEKFETGTISKEDYIRALSTAEVALKNIETDILKDNISEATFSAISVLDHQLRILRKFTDYMGYLKKAKLKEGIRIVEAPDELEEV